MESNNSAAKTLEGVISLINQLPSVTYGVV